jgi:nicotinamidase-related amidase
MASQPKRDPKTDPLLTPENAALLVIDYQPPQINTVRSMDAAHLTANVVALAQAARLFKLPMVLSTVGVKSGLNPDTVPAVKAAMDGAAWIDRTSINAWEDADFVKAVEATGRKKLIMGALWTEVCLAYPALDALRAGYEVFVPVDAVGGTSLAAHDAALRRIEQAGAQPVSWTGVLCELQRDWAREATTRGMVEIAIGQGGPWATEIALKQFASKGLKT